MKILCICLSSTIQRTVTFDSVRIAQVNRSQKYRTDASGKAVNSARILAQLEKGSVTTLCPLGRNNSRQFISLAKKDGLGLKYVLIPGSTRECWTLLDKSGRTTTELVVGEPKANVSCKNQEKKFLGLIKRSLKNADAVLLAGSRPPLWSQDLYPRIAGLAQKSGVLFLADFWGTDLLLTLEEAVPSVIKINDEEFCRTFGLEFPCTEQSLKESIIEKSRELDNVVIVTRGTEPTLAAQRGEFFSVPVERLSPVNTTACGDSFNAGLLYALVKEHNLEAALKKGTWCAARNAENEAPGTIMS